MKQNTNFKPLPHLEPDTRSYTNTSRPLQQGTLNQNVVTTPEQEVDDSVMDKDNWQIEPVALKVVDKKQSVKKWIEDPRFAWDAYNHPDMVISGEGASNYEKAHKKVQNFSFNITPRSQQDYQRAMYFGKFNTSEVDRLIYLYNAIDAAWVNAAGSAKNERQFERRQKNYIKKKNIIANNLNNIRNAAEKLTANQQWMDEFNRLGRVWNTQVFPFLIGSTMLASPPGGNLSWGSSVASNTAQAATTTLGVATESIKNILTNPSTYVSVLGAITGDKAIEHFSDGNYTGWGDWASKSLGVDKWNDGIVKDITQTAINMTHPAFGVPYGKVANTLFTIPQYIKGAGYNLAGNVVGSGLFFNPSEEALTAANRLTGMVPEQYRNNFVNGVRTGNDFATQAATTSDRWLTRNDGSMSNNALYSTIFPVNRFTTSISKTVKNIPNRLKTQLAFYRTNLKNIDKNAIERFTYEKFLNNNISTPRSHDDDLNLLEPGYKINDYWEAPLSLVHVNKNVPGYNNGYGGEKHKQIIKDGTLHRTTYPVNMLRYTERPLPEKYIYWFANRPYYSGNPETQSNFIIKKYNPNTDIVVSKNNHLNYIDEVVSENDIPIDQLEGYYYDPAIKTFMKNKYHDPSLNKQDIGLEGQYNYEDILPGGKYWKIQSLIKTNNKSYQELVDDLRSEPFVINTNTEDDILKFRRAVDSNDRFMAGVELKDRIGTLNAQNPSQWFTTGGMPNPETTLYSGFPINFKYASNISNYIKDFHNKIRFYGITPSHIKSAISLQNLSNDLGIQIDMTKPWNGYNLNKISGELRDLSKSIGSLRGNTLLPGNAVKFKNPWSENINETISGSDYKSMLEELYDKMKSADSGKSSYVTKNLFVDDSGQILPNQPGEWIKRGYDPWDPNRPMMGGKTYGEQKASDDKNYLSKLEEDAEIWYRGIKEKEESKRAFNQFRTIISKRFEHPFLQQFVYENPKYYFPLQQMKNDGLSEIEAYKRLITDRNTLYRAIGLPGNTLEEVTDPNRISQYALQLTNGSINRNNEVRVGYQRVLHEPDTGGIFFGDSYGGYGGPAFTYRRSDGAAQNIDADMKSLPDKYFSKIFVKLQPEKGFDFSGPIETWWDKNPTLPRSTKKAPNQGYTFNTNLRNLIPVFDTDAQITENIRELVNHLRPDQRIYNSEQTVEGPVGKYIPFKIADIHQAIGTLRSNLNVSDWRYDILHDAYTNYTPDAFERGYVPYGFKSGGKLIKQIV